MKKAKEQLPTLLTGALAGLVNGFLGAGGGIIVTYFLSSHLDSEDKNEIFSNAVATMLPISIFSFLLYLARGYFPLDASMLSLLPAAALGGALGAYLLTKLKFKLVKVAFAILVIISGISMIFR